MSEHVPVNDDNPLFSWNGDPILIKSEEERIRLLLRVAELEGKFEELEEYLTKRVGELGRIQCCFDHDYYCNEGRIAAFEEVKEWLADDTYRIRQDKRT